MSKTAIVIDDSSFVVKRLSDLLTKHFSIDVVASGNDGNDILPLYRAHKPDLVTMDIIMPNKDGKQALSELLQEFPQARVLMISAVRGDPMLQCMARGARGYCEKPIRINDEDYIKDFRETLSEVMK